MHDECMGFFKKRRMEFERLKFTREIVVTYKNRHCNDFISINDFINQELYKLINEGIEINTAPTHNAISPVEKPLCIIPIETYIRNFINGQIEKGEIHYFPDTDRCIKINTIKNVRLDYVNIKNGINNWTAYILCESKPYHVRYINGVCEGFIDDGFFTNPYHTCNEIQLLKLNIERLDKVILK